MQVLKKQPDGTFLKISEEFSLSSKEKIISAVRSLVPHLTKDDFWLHQPTKHADEQESSILIKNFPQTQFHELVYDKIMELRPEIPEMNLGPVDVAFFGDD